MSRKKPTMFINFGDHMPSFEGKVFKLKFTEDSGMNDYHKTFYHIRANFDVQKTKSCDSLDITLIPGLILDLIGNNHNPFYKSSAYIRNLCNGELSNCNVHHNNILESYKKLTIEQVNLK